MCRQDLSRLNHLIASCPKDEISSQTKIVGTLNFLQQDRSIDCFLTENFDAMFTIKATCKSYVCC